MVSMVLRSSAITAWLLLNKRAAMHATLGLRSQVEALGVVVRSHVVHVAGHRLQVNGNSQCHDEVQGQQEEPGGRCGLRTQHGHSVRAAQCGICMLRMLIACSMAALASSSFV